MVSAPLDLSAKVGPGSLGDVAQVGRLVEKLFLVLGGGAGGLLKLVGLAKGNVASSVGGR